MFIRAGTMIFLGGLFSVLPISVIFVSLFFNPDCEKNGISLRNDITCEPVLRIYSAGIYVNQLNMKHLDLENTTQQSDHRSAAIVPPAHPIR